MEKYDIGMVINERFRTCYLCFLYTIHMSLPLVLFLDKEEKKCEQECERSV